MLRRRKYKDLETKLGYKFRNEELLTRALTHASVRGDGKVRADNERLEFLGDRVLGLAMVEVLFDAYPEASEGELARRLNRLVNGATCAKVGRELGLGAHLILSDSETNSGGRDKDTILADAVEAILGAAFLDRGFDKACQLVRQLWAGQCASHPKGAADPKSALQEWAQSRGLALPQYIEVSRLGPDHAPKFTAEVRIKGREPARGEGNSKRAAEQAAAAALLDREGVTGLDRHVP
jgi:ribonuclease-3